MKAVLNALTYPCEEIRDFIYDYLEGKLRPMVAVRFRMHIMACGECSEYLRLYKMAASPKKFTQENPPPPEFMNKTLRFLKGKDLVKGDD